MRARTTTDDAVAIQAKSRRLQQEFRQIRDELRAVEVSAWESLALLKRTLAQAECSVREI
jgi:hypothetical protein